MATGAAFDFTDANVLVTGGSNGIGLAVATAFHDAGATVTITGTRDKAADYDGDLSVFDYRQLRLPDPEGVDALAASLERLDVLVNNAGQNLPGGRSEYDPGVFEEVVAVNLFAAFRLAQACEDRLRASVIDGGGSVINVGSMSSFFGIEIVPGYGAAKAGVVQLTKTLAVAWARHGVRVNAVAPGLIESNMTAPMLAFDELMKPILDRTPMGRIGTPDDIAPVVLFLASPAARYMTGQTLAVDGGFSVQG
jgi:NAD(P)-dependent dehydrogenase (short-subunit alcohol dehydrogenase family)